MVKITFAEFFKSVSDLENEMIQNAAHILYERIKQKVPEIESEENKFRVKYNGKDVFADLSQLSQTLQDKINSIDFET